MEEQKLGKTVKMNTEKKKENNINSQQKLTYDQLNNVCAQLYQENQNLVKQLQQANMASMFRRLDYLFMVLKYEAVFKDPDFINSCIDEIKEAITIKEEETEDTKEG
jgi:hypothetical protein